MPPLRKKELMTTSTDATEVRGGAYTKEVCPTKKKNDIDQIEKHHSDREYNSFILFIFKSKEDNRIIELYKLYATETNKWKLIATEIQRGHKSVRER